MIRLQTRLTNLGYLNDTIDGKYGNKTVTAVQLFQQQVGLNATGIADNDTQTRLYADDAPMYNK
ncbi:MAG: peptidoglycan-binding protein [Clostridia bacterium]|nr:peptidoglycan-binding protein [Clostridia bacterium]